MRHRLGAKAADHAGQNIARTRGGEPWRRRIVYGRAAKRCAAVRFGDDRIGSFEQNDGSAQGRRGAGARELRGGAQVKKQTAQSLGAWLNHPPQRFMARGQIAEQPYEFSFMRRQNDGRAGKPDRLGKFEGIAGKARQSVRVENDRAALRRVRSGPQRRQSLKLSSFRQRRVPDRSRLHSCGDL